MAGVTAVRAPVAHCHVDGGRALSGADASNGDKLPLAWNTAKALDGGGPVRATAHRESEYAEVQQISRATSDRWRRTLAILAQRRRSSSRWIRSSPPTGSSSVRGPCSTGQAGDSRQRSFAGTADQEFCPTVSQKAVKLVDAISRAQAFQDGNKRLAWFSMSALIEVNGLILSAQVPQEEAAAWVTDLKGDAGGLREGTLWLNDRLASLA